MDEDYEEIELLGDEFHHALLGAVYEHDGTPVPCYSSGMVVEQFMREGMTEEQAVDYVNDVTEGDPRYFGFTRLSCSRSSHPTTGRTCDWCTRRKHGIRNSGDRCAFARLDDADSDGRRVARVYGPEALMGFGGRIKRNTADKWLSDCVRKASTVDGVHKPWHCQRCGNDYSERHQGLQCSHFIGRQHWGTRYDPRPVGTVRLLSQLGRVTSSSTSTVEINTWR